MIGLVQNAFNQVIRCGHFSWQELEEVLLDVEITLNDRPLTHVEDCVALPVLKYSKFYDVSNHQHLA